MVWTFAIGLAELKLSWFQYEWKFYSWFILLISLVSMLLGMFSMYVLNYNKPLKSIHDTRIHIRSAKLDIKLLFKLTIALFLAYAISYVTIWIAVGFIPIFSPIPNIARTKWSLFGFGLVIHMAPVIIYLVVLYFLSVRKKYSQKVSLLFMVLITVLSFLLLLQRFPLVIPIILSMIFLYYGTKKFRPRNIFLVVVLFVGFMYAMSTIRVSTLFIYFIYFTSKMKFSIDYAFLTEPYMYIVMNLENFANATEKLTTFDYGNFTFDFMLALSGLKHWLIEYNNITESPHLISQNFNTYSMFFVYYRDFGPIGVFLFPLLIGMVIAKLYYKMRISPDIHSISLYGMSTFVIMFSFFVPMLSWLNFVLGLTTIYLVTRLIVIKK